MSTCISPCSDFLVIFGTAAVLFVGLAAYWSGRFDPACRCPTKACSHRTGRRKP